MTDNKFYDYDWERDKRGNIKPNTANQNQMHELLGKTGKGMCLAKWTQVTMHLGNGLTHSCHHPGAHKVTLDELKKNSSALHNTAYKKKMRKQMLSGEKPRECGFCWRIEENGEISDRVLKSLAEYSYPYHDEIINSSGDENYYPSFVEVSFGRTCNFACSYCGPPFSSKWSQEIKNKGPIMVMNEPFNELRSEEEHYNHNEENPYIDAFWEWFPDAYSHMHTLRITGGEPLLMKETFQILDFLLENPNPKLTLGINTNGCPPSGTWDKFVKKIKVLTENGCVKQMDLYTSAEAYGANAEYIRDGMDWDVFSTNIDHFLDNTRNTKVVVMAAFNILSLSTFTEFLEWVVGLKKKYGYHGYLHMLEEYGYEVAQPNSAKFADRISDSDNDLHNRVSVDTPYVRYPEFLDARIADKNLINDYLIPAVAYMYDNVGNNEFNTGIRFDEYECQKLKRNLRDCINAANKVADNGLSSDKKIGFNRAKFVDFVDEYDSRRNKKFLETFPEYKNFYALCQTEKINILREKNAN